MTATEKYLRSRLESEQRLRKAMTESARESAREVGSLSQMMRFLISDAEAVVADPTPYRLDALRQTVDHATDVLDAIDHQKTEGEA